MKLIAAGVIGRMTDAEDIVQQAYAIAIDKNQSFESRDKFLGWLAGIVKHCALNVRRKTQRRKTTPTDPTEIQNYAARGVAKNTSKIDASDLSTLRDAFDDEVMQALEKISEQARICVLLKSVENLTYREIAVLMEIPEGTAMSIVHRARISLRKSLANHEFAKTSTKKVKAKRKKGAGNEKA